jgi:ParB-like chromosome segregation protein Spo0J
MSKILPRRILSIPLDELSLDEQLQQREEGLDPGVVKHYAERLDEVMAEDDKLPVAYQDGETYWLVDGFHRYAAHRKRKRAAMRCQVRAGDWMAAFVHSLGTNAEHGLRRTNADKVRAVRQALQVKKERRLGWSDSEIARMCAVTQPFVGKVRKAAAGGGITVIDPPPASPQSNGAAAAAGVDWARVEEQAAERRREFADESPRSDPGRAARDFVLLHLTHVARGLEMLRPGLLGECRAELDAICERARSA